MTCFLQLAIQSTATQVRALFMLQLFKLSLVFNLTSAGHCIRFYQKILKKIWFGKRQPGTVTRIKTHVHYSTKKP